MAAALNLTARRLTPGDVALLRALNAVFGQAFGEPETYGADPPTDAYLHALLGKEHVIALAWISSAPGKAWLERKEELMTT
jgi:aminoglycoside 3-N-acetyltransferase I